MVTERAKSVSRRVHKLENWNCNQRKSGGKVTIGPICPVGVSRKCHPLTQVVLTCAFSDAVTATLYFALLQNDLETRDEV